MLKICSKCFISYRIINDTDNHVCDQKCCRQCHQIRPIRHDCLIPRNIISERVEEILKKTKSTIIFEPLFIFYDFETVQNQLLLGESDKYKHVVNLVVTQQVCKICINYSDDQKVCSGCSTREHVFMGEESLELFMDYLTKIHKDYHNIICLAHYMKGFDGQFILKYMYENNSKWCLTNNSLIINGSKIFRIKVGRIPVKRVLFLRHNED